MCGGYKIYAKKISPKDLQKFFSIKQIQEIEKRGYFEGHFWDARPLIPAESEGKISLFDWGNRDKKAPFPVTGWAKKESIEQGRWNWLNPKPVKIPVEKGYEKKVWFDLPEGTDGLLVEKEGDKRVYMITEGSSGEYQKLTNHPRMPIGNKQNFEESD